MKLYTLGLLLFVSTAHAQTGDWPRLQSLRHSSTLIVETDVNPYGPATYTRCHINSIDATTLTCTTLGWAGQRIVFPASRIDAVYRVKHSWVKATLGFGTLGLFIGGVLAMSPEAATIGIVTGLAWLIADANQRSAAFWSPWGRPRNPMPDNEKRELIYLRPVVPAPTN